MKHSIDNQEMDERIVSAQVSNLYSALPLSLTVTTINSVLLYLIQRYSVDLATATYWLWTMLAVVFFRFSLFFLYRFPKQEYLKRDNEIWKTIFVSTAIMSGMVWGSSGIFLFPENNIHHQVFLVFVIAGMASGSIATLSAHRITSSLFLVLLLAPITIRFIIIPELLSKVMGLMIFISLVSFLIVSKFINRQLLENIKLSVEAKFREAELLKYSTMLMQTQKLANIVSWEMNLHNNNLKFSPEFNGSLDYLNESHQPIADAIVNAAISSDNFSFELPLTLPNQNSPYWVSIIGEARHNNTQQLHGAIQDISAIKTVQLELDRSRKEALDKAKALKMYAEEIERQNKALMATYDKT